MTTTHLPIRSRLNNVLINVVNHRETNLIITALLIFFCLLIALKSLLVCFELIRQQQHFASDGFLAYSSSQNNLNQFVNRSDHPALSFDQDQTLRSDQNHRPILFLSPDHDLQPSSSFSSADQTILTSNHNSQLFTSLSPDNDHQEHSQVSNHFQQPAFSEHDYQLTLPFDQQGQRSALSPDQDHFHPLVSSPLISLFILLSLSLFLGRLLSYFFIPAITGPILIGILFGNFVPFRSLLNYSPQLSTLIYEIAFLLIIIRSAFGIDQLALRQYFTLCCCLGFVCPLFECVITVLASHFLFHLPLTTSILFGFALCASSLAVISPIILHLKKEQRGTNLGLHSAVLSSIATDNIVALTGFAITYGVLSPRSDTLIYTLTRLPAELLVGPIFGILAALLLRAFPRPDASSVHFVRTFLISAFAVAAYFGAKTIGCALFGLITALFATAVAKIRWQRDNNRNTRLEENALRLAWDLLVGQLLFLHLGLLVDFSAFVLPTLVTALAVLALSSASRFISSLFCAFLCFNNAYFQQSPSSEDRHKERLFLAISTLPKASLQCQLLPLIVQLFPVGNSAAASSLPVHVCLVAVLTVPFGHLLLRLLGKMLLRPALLPMLSSVNSTDLTTTKQSQLRQRTNDWGKETKSDPKDNRLKLEVGRNDETRTNNQMRHQKVRL